MFESKNAKFAGADKDGKQQTRNSPCIPKSERQQITTFLLLNQFKSTRMYPPEYFDVLFNKSSLTEQLGGQISVILTGNAPMMDQAFS